MAQLLDDVGPNSFNVSMMPNGSLTQSYVTYKFGGCSAYLDGSTYYAIPGSTLLHPAPTYTIEVWFRLDADASGTYNYIIDSDNNNEGFAIYILNSSNLLYTTAKNYNDNIYVSHSISRGVWNHVVMEVNDTNNSIYMGLNGVRYTGTTDSNFNIVPHTQTVYIGSRQPGNTSLFKGYLDDLRISSGLVYNLGTYSTYTVPTTPLGVTANTVLLMPFDESQYAISGNLTEPGRIIIREESDWSTIHNQHYSAGAFQVSVPNVNKKMIVCRSDSGEIKGYGNITPKII